MFPQNRNHLWIHWVNRRLNEFSFILIQQDANNFFYYFWNSPIRRNDGEQWSIHAEFVSIIFYFNIIAMNNEHLIYLQLFLNFYLKTRFFALQFVAFSSDCERKSWFNSFFPKKWLKLWIFYLQQFKIEFLYFAFAIVIAIHLSVSFYSKFLPFLLHFCAKFVSSLCYLRVHVPSTLYVCT